MPMAELQVRFFSLRKIYSQCRFFFPVTISFFCMEIKALEAATTVNARGDLLVDRLQDIPNHAKEIATHGVH